MSKTDHSFRFCEIGPQNYILIVSIASFLDTVFDKRQPGPSLTNCIDTEANVINYFLVDVVCYKILW